MDRSFLAIATILHRVPRDAGKSPARPKPGSPPQREHEHELRDVPDGWIRFAL